MDSTATKASIDGPSSWRDITKVLKESAHRLDLGELLKCDCFTLLEAMSAIELMDPKMDSGMILKQCTRKVYNLEQSIKNNLIKVNNLEPKELAGIIDNTYACLTTWLEGYPSAQTVMTNLYLHDPELIQDRCLKVFSQAILKIIEFVDRLVYMTYCIEEEDFVLDCNRFNLAGHLNDQKVLNSIEDLCQYYEHLLINATRSPKDKPTNDSLNGSNDDSKEESLNNPDDLTSILDRLRFTLNFYGFFYTINRHILQKIHEFGSLALNQLQKIVKIMYNSLDQCDLYLCSCSIYLENWNKSIDFGIKPDPKVSNSEDFPIIMGFEPLINQKHAPPAYPRSPSILSRPTMINYLSDLIKKLRQCVSIANTFSNSSFLKCMDSFEKFSKCPKPPSCVVSRAFLQILYLANRSIFLFKNELEKSLFTFCEPLMQELIKTKAGVDALDEFLNLSQPFSQAIIIYGYNTARQHEKYPELIFSLKNQQYSALYIHHEFNNIVLYSWVTFHLARFSIKYLLAGLELDLYSWHEYTYVFWYLYEILYRTERDQIDQARQIILDNISSDIQKKGKIKRQRRKNQAATMFHDEYLTRIDALRSLSEGIFLLAHGLKIQEKIQVPKMDYTNEVIRFQHRFRMIGLNIQVYQYYRKTIDSLKDLGYIYKRALERFAEAKLFFDALQGEEIQNCLRVTKTNMIVAKILSSNFDSFKDRVIEFSFEVHPSFPIVKFN